MRFILAGLKAGCINLRCRRCVSPVTDNRPLPKYIRTTLSECTGAQYKVAKHSEMKWHTQASIVRAGRRPHVCSRCVEAQQGPIPQGAGPVVPRRLNTHDRHRSENSKPTPKRPFNLNTRPYVRAISSWNGSESGRRNCFRLPVAWLAACPCHTVLGDPRRTHEEALLARSRNPV